MNKLKIGWAEEKFEFTKPVSLDGQFAERISEYTEKPLCVTAMAVESKGEQMVLCSVDIITVTCVLNDAVRDLLKDNKLGLDPMKVVISAIHTHTGPGYTGRGINAATRGRKISTPKAMFLDFLPPDMKYVESINISDNNDIMSRDDVLKELTEKIAKAVLTAWENRKEGGYANAFGRAPVGMCRRAKYTDGSAKMWGDTNTAVFDSIEGGSDNGIELLYIFDANNKLTGIVANLACPAQCIQHRKVISPDFWGEAKMLLRKEFGEDLYFLTLCSAAGDQCPVDLVRWVEPESDVNDPNITRNNPLYRKADPSMFDLKGMKKVGRRVANEIIDVYNEENLEIKKEAEFVHTVESAHLPLRRATLKKL